MTTEPEVARLTGTVLPVRRRSVLEWLTRRSDRTDGADWAIMSAKTGEFLGAVGLGDFRPETACAKLRISLLSPTLFGQGYGTAAAVTALQYGFDQVKLQRVSLEVFDFNERAQRSYLKAGFRHEGLLRQAHHDENGWHDVVVMAALANDVRPQPTPKHPPTSP